MSWPICIIYIPNNLRITLIKNSIHNMFKCCTNLFAIKSLPEGLVHSSLAQSLYRTTNVILPYMINRGWFIFNLPIIEILSEKTIFYFFSLRLKYQKFIFHIIILPFKSICQFS